jgi:hypothetical protein
MTDGPPSTSLHLTRLAAKTACAQPAGRRENEAGVARAGPGQPTGTALTHWHCAGAQRQCKCAPHSPASHPPHLRFGAGVRCAASAGVRSWAGVSLGSASASVPTCASRKDTGTVCGTVQADRTRSWHSSGRRWVFHWALLREARSPGRPPRDSRLKTIPVTPKAGRRPQRESTWAHALPGSPQAAPPQEPHRALEEPDPRQQTTAGYLVGYGSS